MPRKNLTDAFLRKVEPTGTQVDYFDDSIPGFCMRVSQNGRKTWCVYYRFGGLKVRYTFGTYPITPLAEARQTAKDALYDVAHGINPATKKKADRDAETFAYLAGEYLERYAKQNKKSWEEDQRILNHDLLPSLGKIKAKDITKRKVNEILERKAATAPIQANRTRSVLNKIFRWAIKKDEFGIEANPVYLTDRPGGDESKRARDRVLAEQEIKAVWKALDMAREADKSHRKYQMLSAGSLKLRLLTAQRGGEVMAMEWSEIEDNWWTIPASKTKNGLAHRVPLTPLALRIIDEMKAVTMGTGKKTKPLTEFVFPGPRGGHIENVQKAIQRIRKSTGIEFRGHDLRRTAATQMTKNGIPRFTVGRILNHIEPGVTKIYDRYSYDREKLEALETWSRHLQIIISDLREVKAEA